MSGAYQAISSTVITLNLAVSCTCGLQKKNKPIQRLFNAAMVRVLDAHMRAGRRRDVCFE